MLINENLNEDLFAPPTDAEIAEREAAREVYLQAHPEERKTRKITELSYAETDQLCSEILERLLNELASATATTAKDLMMSVAKPKTACEIQLEQQQRNAQYGESPVLKCLPLFLGEIRRGHWLFGQAD